MYLFLGKWYQHRWRHYFKSIIAVNYYNLSSVSHTNSAAPQEPKTSNPAVANKGIKRKGKKDVIGKQIVKMVRGIYDNRSARDEFVVLGEEVANSVRNYLTMLGKQLNLKFKLCFMKPH